MELKMYFRILLKRWWIIPLTFIFTLIPTYIFVSGQPWVYESEATFVIRPRTSVAVNDDEIVKALDTVSRRVEIITTFAEVSSSSLIKQRAVESLGLSAEEQEGLKVNGRVLAGTNILEINVQGPDPKIVRDLATAVSMETLSYVSNLYDVFELEPLDGANIPNRPVSPNKTLNLAIGAALGLLLGVGLIFLIEYLKEPLVGDLQINVIDPETGAYNQTYFKLRLGEELSRARHNTYSFSLALIKVYHRDLVYVSRRQVPSKKVLRHIFTNMKSKVREEDILAYMGQGTFALLLPHMSGDDAKDVLSILRTQFGMVSPDQFSKGQESAVYIAIGFADYQQQEKASEMLNQAARALDEADMTVHGTVHSFTPSATHTQQASNSSISTISSGASR